MVASISGIAGGSTLNTNSGTKTATVTPAVNDLPVIITYHTGNTSAATPTDNNADGLGTYTRVAVAVKVSSGDTMQIFVRDALIGSATSTVVTHAPGASSGGGILVMIAKGMSRVKAAAARQTGKQDNTAAATPAPAFPGAALTTSLLLGAIMSGTNPAALTKPATFDTEELDNGYNSPTTGIEVVSDDGGNTDTTVTWGSATLTEFCALIVELDTTVVSGAAALTGTGSMTVAGVRTRNGAAALTGTGSSTVAGVRTRLGAAALTGTGSATVAGTRTTFGAAALTGTGSATVAGVRTRYGAAALTGAGSATVAGVRTTAGAAALSGQGSATVAGVRTTAGAAALTGLGSMVVAGTHEWMAAAALVGSGSVVVAGVRTRFGAAALVGTGSETIAGTLVREGAAALVGVGSLTADGFAITGGSALLTGTGSMVVDGTIHTFRWPFDTPPDAWPAGTEDAWPFDTAGSW